MYYCCIRGCVWAGILALHWSDIKDGVITVRQSLAKAEGGGYELKSTKSGKVRYVGVTQNLQNIL